MTVTLRIDEQLMSELRAHLFPGDRAEHGAVIAASVLETKRGTRLLAHKIFIARPGQDYIPGTRGHRMLSAEFVLDCAMQCADLKMAYLAVHCHGGRDRVAFSKVDIASHERGYPALLDLLDGPPVGALVFAPGAVAGDIWFADGRRQDLKLTIIAGRPLEVLRDAPAHDTDPVGGRFNRQVRLFGDHGQRVLQAQKVGVIGAGGAGSIVVEQLTRLGVGQVVLLDPERLELSNVSRVVGSRPCDAGFKHPRGGFWRSVERAFRVPAFKVDIAARAALKGGSVSRVDAHRLDVVDGDAADLLRDCDYLFLAADTMQARLVFNALVHQYLIPGVQMGAKAQIDKETGEILSVFAVTRPVIPGQGCLWCNGLIDPAKLQDEATSAEQLKRQRYVDDVDVGAPSVITLNGVAASTSTNDFLMTLQSFLRAGELRWLQHDAMSFQTDVYLPRSDDGCRECSRVGRLGRGPTRSLPTRRR